MEYNSSIITYVDILGFKNIVNQSKTIEVHSILEKFRHFSKPDEEIAQEYEQSFINFSDCSVRITKILSKVNKTRPVGLLFYELLDVLHLQFELVNLGIFIRGGITIGYIYNQDNYIFGPGLIDAYELESITAKYPRIVIPKMIVEKVKDDTAIKAYHHDVEEELEYISDLLKYDEEGFYFIDYIKASDSEMGTGNYLLFLSNHKLYIEKNLSFFAKDEKVLPKYLWLKEYHNSSVLAMEETFFINHSTQKSRLLI